MSACWIVPDWPAPAKVRACVTTRQTPGVSRPPFEHCNLGSRCGDDPQAVACNREGLVSVLKLPAAPVWLQQVHGTQVHVADAMQSAEPQADASVTRSAGIVLAILTADCLPVLFCARDGSEVAAAHAGWRGLHAGVLESTIAHMHSKPYELLAWIGPAIGAASYEVGSDVRDAFVNQHPESASAFSATRPGHWNCELAAIARQRLFAAGIAKVGISGIDTRTDPRFYSYRKASVTGRFASLIWRT